MAQTQLSMSAKPERNALGASAALLIMLITVHSQLPGLANAQAAPPASPNLSSIPEACINTGTELQTQCAETLTAAQTFFNIQNGPDGQPAPGAPNITQQQIDDYVAKAPAPTPACCKAACDFNAHHCSCDQGVLDFSVQLTANNPEAYKSVALGFASACQFQAHYGPTCVPQSQQAAVTAADLQRCSALPPPIPAGKAQSRSAATETPMMAGNATGLAAVGAVPVAAAAGNASESLNASTAATPRIPAVQAAVP